MTYTTTLRKVRDFVARREIASQSLVYSVRSNWRRGVSLGWNSWLFSRLTNNALLRLSLHPPDVLHPAIWRQVREIIGKALQDRKPMTYQSWLMSLVTPSGVEGSRDESFKIAPLDPPTALRSARDDGKRRRTLSR
jgi:hypothetical protein